MKPLLAKRVENLEAQVVNGAACHVRLTAWIEVLATEIAEIKKSQTKMSTRIDIIEKHLAMANAALVSNICDTNKLFEGLSVRIDNLKKKIL